jgi:ankyrin repeat protein
MRKKIIYPEKTPLYILSDKKVNYPEMSVDNFQDYIVNAAKYQRLNDLTFLLESGDNVNQSDKNGNTVLHYLVRHRSPMAKEAIYAGAEINKANKDGETPYFWAVRYGTVETRAMLLSLGANPDILNKAGKKANEYNYVTSFNDAVRNKDYKVIKSILVNYPSLVNDFLYNGLSLVGFAIVNKNNDLLKLLLNYKANPNIFSENSAISTLGMIWNNNRSYH